MSNEIEGAMPPLPAPMAALYRDKVGQRRWHTSACGGDDIAVFSAAYMHAYAKAYAAPLVARVEELQADAARYRWLFSDGPSHTPIAGTASMTQSRGPYVVLDPPSLNSFSGMVLDKVSADHFIDAALAAKD